MARLNPGFSDEEFIGYTFRGVPERRPRLWFLDRDLFTLMLWEQHLMAEGRWSVRPDQIRQLDKTWPADKALWEPESIGAALQLELLVVVMATTTPATTTAATPPIRSRLGP